TADDPHHSKYHRDVCCHGNLSRAPGYLCSLISCVRHTHPQEAGLISFDQVCAAETHRCTREHTPTHTHTHTHTHTQTHRHTHTHAHTHTAHSPCLSACGYV